MTARRRAKPDPASEPTEEEKAFRVEFGRRMRVLRVARGLSQEELARRTDMSRPFLGAVESGKHGLQVAACCVWPAGSTSRRRCSSTRT